MISNTGWKGKILHLNLSTGESEVLCPADSIYHRFIGGKGMAGYYLRPHITLPWNHQDMPLLIFTGPLVGTTAPTSGRSTIMSRSPLTGTIADSSVGGRLGFQLKRAGWDGIIITERSEVPCGIEIEDDSFNITDAAAHWGKDTLQFFNEAADGQKSVSVIGPAAENGVAFSALMVDKHHAAGRTGIGLCFAAKHLKYITVHGTGKVSVTKKKEGDRKSLQRLGRYFVFFCSANNF